MLPSSAPLNSLEIVQFGPKDTAGGAAVKRLTGHRGTGWPSRGRKTEIAGLPGSGHTVERCKTQRAVMVKLTVASTRKAS
jgi:hypothetical protein